MGKELSWDEKCYNCGKELNEADLDAYEPQMCCSGRECGCLGLPTNPPVCLDCSAKEK